MTKTPPRGGTAFEAVRWIKIELGWRRTVYYVAPYKWEYVWSEKRHRNIQSVTEWEAWGPRDNEIAMCSNAIRVQGKDLDALTEQWQVEYDEMVTRQAEKREAVPDLRPLERDERDDYGTWRTGVTPQDGGKI
tara:strand:+ start:1637 stop:2035 length:399 start_codon:yes stop_codon:yes gene_type:complete